MKDQDKNSYSTNISESKDVPIFKMQWMQGKFQKWSLALHENHKPLELPLKKSHFQ